LEELDLPGTNLLKHGIVQFELWDTDLAWCGAARHTERVLEATRAVAAREATRCLGGGVGSKEACMAGQAARSSQLPPPRVRCGNSSPRDAQSCGICCCQWDT